jgi:LysM repeat protein
MKKDLFRFRRGVISLAAFPLFLLLFSVPALAASHTVSAGDTLWGISQRYGTTVDRLMQANGLRGTIIFPGQLLSLPDDTANPKKNGVPGQAPVSRGFNGSVSAADFDLLARIITAEADNQDHRTKVAVGAVVLNRVKSPLFPDSIRGVVYQAENGIYQFEPVLNGWINRPASESARQAAREALSGSDPTGGALFFWESWVRNRFLNFRPIAGIMGEFTFTY